MYYNAKVKMYACTIPIKTPCLFPYIYAYLSVMLGSLESLSAFRWGEGGGREAEVKGGEVGRGGAGGGEGGRGAGNGKEGEGEGEEKEKRRERRRGLSRRKKRRRRRRRTRGFLTQFSIVSGSCYLTTSPWSNRKPISHKVAICISERKLNVVWAI